MSRRTRRRGIVLLVVLSTLVLFTLAALTLVITAGHYRRSAVIASSHERSSGDPRGELDLALYQVVRGPRDPSSSLYGHSLLNDLYGSDGMRGEIAAVRQTQNDPLLLIRYKAQNVQRGSVADLGGAIFTVIDGPAAGCSTRIVFSGRGWLRTEPLVGDLAGALPRAGDHFCINGLPFNGTGAGYNPSTHDLSASLFNVFQDHSTEVALLPHLSRYEGKLPHPVHIGGADESWDAVDYQNMFLAAPSEGIPSFHRPALIRYWSANFPDLWNKSEFRRLAVLRPLPDDHPEFTGSNPAWKGQESLDTSLINGPWDVDNDGDGTADSVWLDLGVPVGSLPTGQLYKPLFAVLCVDLDGRLNINAHGNLTRLRSETRISWERGPYAGYLDQSSINLPQGRGYGPGEISLSTVLGEETSNLLSGVGSVPGRLGVGRREGADEPHRLAHVRRRLGKQPRFVDDRFGICGVALDHVGYPFVVRKRGSFRDARLGVLVENDPYVLRAGSQYASPFSLAELERLLRWYDRDTEALPVRLLSLFQNPLAEGRARRLRRLLTTNSAHVPTATTLPPTEMRRAEGPIRSLVELLAAKLRASGVPEEQIAVESRVMLSPDLLRGRRMNINYDFGNGVDDNRNGVVDEPMEAAVGEEVRERALSNKRAASAIRRAVRGVPIWLEHTRNDPLITDPARSRQIHARHLYCLMRLLTDVGNDNTDQILREKISHRLAQWAINVVDFRDADSIMTPFEFDINPFDGWRPMDGDPATDEGGDRRIVWGCEYPELLITETLAYHDRRVRDTDKDDGPREKRWIQEDGEHMVGDSDLDQDRVPKGSLFLELYCTRGPVVNESDANSPAELYDKTHSLDLGRLAPAGADGLRYPVWRIAITIPHGGRASKLTSDREDAMAQSPSVEDVERIVWLSSAAPTVYPEPGRIYFNRSPNMKARIGRGQYAVIGPPDAVGRRSDWIPVAAMPPSDWTNAALTAPRGIGLSVSEPLPQASYYPEPMTVSAPGRFDGYGGRPPDHPFDNYPHTPLAMSGAPTLGTQFDFRSALLQRLANPLVPYHPTRNPYLTVDSATIDVTVFNSTDRSPRGYPVADLGPFDSSPHATPSAKMRFASRERGRPDGNIWTAMTAPPMETQPRHVPAEVQVYRGARHTLGRLNAVFLMPGESALAEGPYKGAPPYPFPWLTWNNCPFTNHFELVLVPSSSPARLLHEFNMASHFGAPTGHLLDFFDRSRDPYRPFFRAFDYVEVPSRYARSDRWLNPRPSSGHMSQPVFDTTLHRLSRFRDPGRININTIFDSKIWEAIASGFPPMNSECCWSAIARSREGFRGQPASQFPTSFANPFRAASTANMMPLSQLKRPGAQATMLRSHPDDDLRPLFTVDAEVHPKMVLPHRNQNRNAFFYYQGFMRLGSLLTTQSNVFAIWITVGYFEVKPHKVDAAHPDGYQLSRELGENTGEVRRHRGFYIVDRSVPVAHEPGRNHNVDRAILLRRFIE